ncbi:2-hydroxy-palmitic acid dioxygenase mpo1-like [Rhodamnia argentea]|uniref:2-hydroxy-palmitic acid dioxygenase mpo1-like n=1 Tax=Rhodamnia argentea TaxID=178133 RepID=A0A8B8QNB0_9MYRT|nr:2-hydroxy-palmitic acid dioxygenase mpo1-like [Rhodamnia argentea]
MIISTQSNAISLISPKLSTPVLHGVPPPSSHALNRLSPSLNNSRIRIRIRPRNPSCRAQTRENLTDPSTISEGKVETFAGFEMAKTGLFDLERHFAFYGAYHSNPVNVAIHTVFVWPILFTALLLLCFTPPLFGLPRIELSLFGHDLALVLNVGCLLTLVYSTFYVFLDPRAGSLAALLCLICWVAASFVASRLGFSLAWKVVLVAQIVCWTGQFIGHGVFEKRAPALLDNLAQAFLMAPFFVLLEALQTFFGYEPYPGFRATVEAKIDAEVSDWKDKQEKLIP